MDFHKIAYADARGTGLTGLLVGGDGANARPAIVIFSDVLGIGDHITAQARRLADLGYAAFVGDMYGGGMRHAEPGAAFAARAALLADPLLLRDRARSAVRHVAGLPGVSDRIAVAGYCFGGTIALELARDHAPIRAAVSLHGDLEPVGGRLANSDIAVLSYTGGADPLIPRSQVDAFRDEVEAAGCPWQIVVHGGAGHSFTDPGSDAFNIPGIGYHSQADRQSFAMMADLFANCLC